MVDKELEDFIIEARRRGFSDSEIKKPLIEKGWDEKKINEAFLGIMGKTKNKICVYIDSDVMKIVEKRAKRNMLTPEEMIEDIIRRSAVNAHGIKREDEKLDDLLVTVFSRKRTGKGGKK